MQKLIKRPKGLKVTDDTEHNLLIGKLYQTEIVRYQQNNLILRSGGWFTAHTKKCINLILSHYELGLKVSQVKGQWYVSNLEGKSVSFQDGMRISI